MSKRNPTEEDIAREEQIIDEYIAKNQPEPWDPPPLQHEYDRETTRRIALDPLTPGYQYPCGLKGDDVNTAVAVWRRRRRAGLVITQQERAAMRERKELEEVLRADPYASKMTHREWARMHFCGMKHEDIAKRFGVMTSSVTQTLATPKIRAYLRAIEQRREDLVVQDPIKMLDKAAPDAVNLLADTVRAKRGGEDFDPTRKQLDAAKVILGKAVPDKRVSLNVNVDAVFTPEEALKAQAALKGLGAIGLLSPAQLEVKETDHEDEDDVIDVAVDEVFGIDEDS